MKEKEKFDFNDILIKPSKVSDIESRKGINPFYKGFLPLITAPMDTVINKNNIKLFESLKTGKPEDMLKSFNISFNMFSVSITLYCSSVNIIFMLSYVCTFYLFYYYVRK